MDTGPSHDLFGRVKEMLCLQIHQEWGNGVVSSSLPPLQHVPRKRLRALLDANGRGWENITRLLIPDASQVLQENIKSQVFRKDGCSIILLIILCQGTPRMLASFRRTFLDHTSPHGDTTLPFRKSIANQVFGSTGGLFYKSQFHFYYARILENRFDTDLTDVGPAVRPPYLEEKTLGQGLSSDKVVKVKIMSGCYYFTRDSSHNSENISLARKDFQYKSVGDWRHKAFRRENEILEDLRLNRTGCPNTIIEPRGSITHRTDFNAYQASIFLEPAICSLYQYLNEKKKPERHREKIENIERMMGIVNAFAWLHGYDGPQSLRNTHHDLHLSHCDVKPSNILVCLVNGREVFKLSDFGSATILQADTNSSSTVRPGSYLGPEKTLHVSSDIWPLGCILLLVVLFNMRGPNEFAIFQSRRKASDDKDTFWQEGSHASTRPKRKVKDAVTTMISGCIQSTRDTTHQRLLVLIRDGLLQCDPDRRLDSRTVYQKMKEACDSPVQPRICDLDRELNGVTECYQSPDGHLEALFKKDESLWLGHRTGRELPDYHPVTLRWYRENHLDLQCGNDALFQSAVVSTSDSECPKIEFNIDGPNREDTSEGGSVNLKKGIEPVSKYTFSPDRRFLATVGKHPTTKYKPPIVRLLDIPRLMCGRTSRTRSMSDSDDSISGPFVKDSDVLNMDVDPQSRFDAVTRHIQFSSTGNYLYFVRSGNERRPDHASLKRIRFRTWETSTKTLLDCRDIDHEHNITSFAPFHKRCGFVTITDGSFHVRDDTPDIRSFEERAKALKKVLITVDDEFAVFLGGSSKDVQVYICQRGRWTDMQKAKIEGKIRFDENNGDAAAICLEGSRWQDGAYLIITSPIRKNHTSISLWKTFRNISPELL